MDRGRIQWTLNSMSVDETGTAAEARANALPPLLSIDRVIKDYVAESERVRALNDVSLDAEAGRFIALVGRSGCGKSTLLHLAGAMDFPTSGHVRLDGVATDALNEAGLTRLRREKVGFVFQSFQLLNTLSVVENVEVPLLLAGHNSPRPVAIERLASVGLEDLAHRMTHQLSGGQMQRVAIARALVHGPRLLLADEPTGNLDTATGNAVLELLRRICNEHKVTILMATHSAEAAAIADSVVPMRDGRIVSTDRIGKEQA
jgi:putative ABC transport system ATP-binding protein